jgi:NAD(P)-dependent dehydrogenase (short-subunit alcohol dehydrogenase family)
VRPEKVSVKEMQSTDAVVVMTGAAGGLGGAMTRGLLEAGRRVVAIDIEATRDAIAVLETDAAKLGAGERLHCVTADIRSEADCERAVASARERFGAVHALVNNAGIGMSALSLDAQDCKVPFYELPADFWRTLFDINVNGSFLMARAVAPHLVAQGWGRIINVTTGLFTMVRGGFTPYGPAKAAMEAATAAWSEEFAGTGITVNALLPGGAADTSMVPHESVADRSTLVAPRKMVAPVVWLTSPAADGVTGIRIIGNDWDSAAPAADNLAKCARAGWKK